MPPPIPHTFNRKKATILKGLSVPASEYSDKSPKGSVDERIRELIDEINAYDGFVTTSSCAGRIAVFQEGNGPSSDSWNEEDAVGSSGVPGGKGGGKFLFVSHEPVYVAGDVASQQLPRILGLEEEPGACGARGSESWAPGQRFVRFAFEPMILHVMTASLHHAKPLLSAAINSGFRESGVQSLKNLDDPNACPMLAIRTAGLGLEAIIASVAENSNNGPYQFWQLVTKEYYAMLLKIANERFEANQLRIEKFRVSLRETMKSESQKSQHNEKWESPEARRERKRDQGLRAKEAAQTDTLRRIESKTTMSSEDDDGYLNCIFPFKAP